MIQDIKENETEINPYASTNEAEFFAVIAEYFFEKPTLLERNHPHLYAMLTTIFKPK
jgi:Mlc titration factor MtfA (ptsG expression regulator)